MKEIEVTDQKRTDLGKKASKQLRKEGLIPHNLYDEAQWDGKPVAFLFIAPMSELRRLVYILHIYVVESTIGGEGCTAVLKELQFHPVADTLLHVGFYEVNDQKSIVMGVPIEFIGSAQGVCGGGRMNMPICKVSVKTPYQQIPEHLDINVTELRLGKSIKVGELSFEGLESVAPKEVVVCSTKATRNSIQAVRAAATAGAE